MEINTKIETKEKKIKKGPGVSDSKNDGQGVDIVPTSDYKLNSAGKKYRAHRIVFNKGEDDGSKPFNGVNEHMKKTFNSFVEQHTADLTEEQLNEIVEELHEVLGKDQEAGKWISDFVHSDNPKFAGKSKEKRKQMALAAYYAAQRNEEAEILEALKGKQNKLDKNKNGKLDAQDFKLLRKEDTELDECFISLEEAYDPEDYKAGHEKSKFKDGYRATLTHKTTGKVSYVGGTAYKAKEHAEGEAETYKKHYSVGTGKMVPGANMRHDRAVSEYRKKAKEAGQIAEGWNDMLADVKKKAESEKKTTTRTAHDVKHTSTGTVYTKQRDADGNSKEFNRSGEAAQKRGRGRPKKNSFGEAVEFLMGLDEETFDSFMEEGFDSFMEHYEQLDEISKATLGSYIKKAGRDAVIQRKIGADFEHQADKSRKPGMKASATALADKYKAKSWSRSHNVNKAVDRLTK